jgi:hypothetical protein
MLRNKLPMRINFRFPVALLILIILLLSQGNLFAQDKNRKRPIPPSI